MIANINFFIGIWQKSDKTIQVKKQTTCRNAATKSMRQLSLFMTKEKYFMIV